MVIRIVIISLMLLVCHLSQAGEQSNFEKERSVLIKKKQNITTWDIYRLIKKSKDCHSYFNVIKKGSLVVTGLPLFNISSNKKNIMSAVKKILSKCKK